MSESITLDSLTPPVLEGLQAFVPAYDGKEACNNLVTTARTLKAVKTQDEHTLAVRYAADLAGKIKAIKSHFDPYCKSAHALWKACVALRDGPCDVLDTENKRLVQMALGYQQECERQRREEARKAEEAERKRREDEAARIEQEAQAEAARLEEAARVAREAEAEAKRLGDAEEEERQRQLAILNSASATQEINQAVQRVQEVHAEPIKAAFVSPSVPTARSAGAAARTDWVVDEENIDLKALVFAAAENDTAWAALGRFLTLDLSAAKAEARLRKDKCNIPGVRVIEKQGMTIRATK